MNQTKAAVNKMFTTTQHLQHLLGMVLVARFSENLSMNLRDSIAADHDRCGSRLDLLRDILGLLPTVATH